MYTLLISGPLLFECLLNPVTTQAVPAGPPALMTLTWQPRQGLARSPLWCLRIGNVSPRPPSAATHGLSPGGPPCWACELLQTPFKPWQEKRSASLAVATYWKRSRHRWPLWRPRAWWWHDPWRPAPRLFGNGFGSSSPAQQAIR